MSTRALFLLAVAAATGGAAKDPLAGRTPGPPTDCISLSQVTGGPTVTDDGAILYRESGRRIWRTTPVGTCPALRPDVTLITEVYGGRLCRNDRFRVLEWNATIPSEYCRFGAFTPYDKSGR